MRKETILLLVNFILILTIIIILPFPHAKKQQKINIDENQYTEVIPLKETIVEEPDWIEYSAIRKLDKSLGNVLSDIDAHMPAGHIYKDRDKVTWAHETTHGINANIRNQYKSNAFYCLNDKAVLISGPKIKKSNVTRIIPKELQGMSFGLYMAGQRAWDEVPLYILDEWVAYTNGSAAGLDLAKNNLWNDGNRSSTIQSMIEFNGYALGLLVAIKQLVPDYYNTDDGKQLIKFVKWNLKRSVVYLNESKNYPDFSDSRHDKALDILLNSKLYSEVKDLVGDFTQT